MTGNKLRILFENGYVTGSAGAFPFYDIFLDGELVLDAEASRAVRGDISTNGVDRRPELV